MFFEFFMLGTFWFWTLIISEFILLTYWLESYEYKKWDFHLFSLGSLLTVIILIGLMGSGIGDLLQWVAAHPEKTVLFIIAYFGSGIVYSVAKWWLFVRNIRDINRDVKEKWLSNCKKTLDVAEQRILNLTNREQIEKETAKVAALKSCNGVMTKELFPFWKEYEKSYEESYRYYDCFSRYFSIVKPEPKNYKGRITAWLVYWPPSLFWMLLNDPLRYIGRRLYELVADLMKNISDTAWKDEDNVE